MTRDVLEIAAESLRAAITQSPRTPTQVDRASGPGHKFRGYGQYQERLPWQIFDQQAIPSDRALGRQDSDPAACSIERHHLLTASEVSKVKATGVQHRLRRTGHEPLPQSLTACTLGDQYSSDSNDRDLDTTHTDRATRPTHVSNDAVSGSGDHVEIMGRVAVRLIRVP